VLGGEEVAEFAVKEGAVAGVHGDDLEAHAGFFVDAANDGAAANLSRGGIQQELNGAAQWHGPPGANEEAAKSEAVHVGNVAGHAGSPGNDEGPGRFDAGIFALVRNGHKEGQPGLNSLVGDENQVQRRIKITSSNVAAQG